MGGTEITTLSGTTYEVDDGPLTTAELAEFWDEDWGHMEIDIDINRVIIDSRGTPQSAIDYVRENVSVGVVVDVVNESIPSATMNELAEMWDEEWGWIDYSDPAALVVHDKSVPLHIKNTIERIRPSCVAVEYVDERGDNDSDTSCVDSTANDDQSHTESKSFAEEMCELADDLDEKQREREEQRVDEYLRGSRDVFQAEITEVRESIASQEKLTFVMDIPTYGQWNKSFYLPNGEDDGSGQRLYEILGYLGATLRDMDMVEGMYLPVTYNGSYWEISLPSDESGGYVGDGYIGTAVGLCKPLTSVSLPSVSLSSPESWQRRNRAIWNTICVGVIVGSFIMAPFFAGFSFWTAPVFVFIIPIVAWYIGAWWY